MADNNGWETAASRSNKKKAQAAAAAEKEKRDAIIKSMTDLLDGIFASGSRPDYQTLKMATIAGLRAMGETKNAEKYERMEEEHKAYLREEAAKAARKREQNAQMAKNKAKVNAHFGPLSGHKFGMRKSVMKTRWMGQTIDPSNANVYADLARDVNREVAEKEDAERWSHRQWQDSYYGSYGRNYSTGRPPRYNYDDYGSAAQGGPGPRAYAAPAAAPAMYPILGVPVTASEVEIKAAYREKALRGQHRHPNKGGDTEEFKKLQREYETAIASLGAEGGRRKTRRSRHRRSKTRKNRS